MIALGVCVFVCVCVCVCVCVRVYLCAYVCKGPQAVKFFLKINSQSPYYARSSVLTTPTEHVRQASLRS